jgi:tRNA A37 threonylcarbamoyladenosine modification protein TsaB
LRTKSIEYTPEEWVYVEMKVGFGECYNGNYTTLVRVGNNEVSEKSKVE